jgi:acid phosphatase type 7
MGRHHHDTLPLVLTITPPLVLTLLPPPPLPPQLKHLDWVRVTYTGLPKNDDGVFFGVYYPANASTAQIPQLPYPAASPNTANYPFKWISCSSMPGCTTGSGYYDFELIQAFADAKVVAFTNGTTYPVALASTPALTFTDTNLPFYGHLARTLDPTEMIVVWNSANNDDNPQVQYGTTPGGPYPNTAYAESVTYFKEDLCSAPANSAGWYPPFYWPRARLTNLTAGSTQPVYYRFGSPVNGFSAEMSFLPSPATGAVQPSPIHIALVADMGVTELDGSTDHWAEPDASLTMQHVRDWVQGGSGYDYSLALHPGDLSYATGQEGKWNLFMTRLAGIYDRIPYAVGEGNHERDTPGSGSSAFPTSVDSGGECGVPTITRFPSPTIASPEWYAYPHGSVMVIMLNSEIEVNPGSAQFDFLNSTLTAVDRTVTPWVVIAMHRPMYYVDDSAAGGTIDAYFQTIEPALVENKVDLFLVGHVHNAYTSCPVIAGKCVTPSTPGGYDGPVHISIGNAGQGLTPINTKTQPEWVNYQASEFGYATLHVWNTTVMTVNLYGDDDNGLRTTVTVSRAWPRPY